MVCSTVTACANEGHTDVKAGRDDHRPPEHVIESRGSRDLLPDEAI